MKSFALSFIRLALASLALVSIMAAQAQTTSSVADPAGKLQIDDLDRLALKASQAVNVNLPERLLRIVPPVLTDTDGDKVKELILGLKGIYVRRFEFDTEGQYTEADMSSLRAQLRSPAWSRIVEVRSRREGTNVEVYIMDGQPAGRIGGLAIIASEPKELTVVNIVGAIDLDKLSKLEGEFGVPELELERTGKTPPQKKKQ